MVYLLFTNLYILYHTTTTTTTTKNPVWIHELCSYYTQTLLLFRIFGRPTILLISNLFLLVTVSKRLGRLIVEINFYMYHLYPFPM